MTDVTLCFDDKKVRVTPLGNGLRKLSYRQNPTRPMRNPYVGDVTLSWYCGFCIPANFIRKEDVTIHRCEIVLIDGVTHITITYTKKDATSCPQTIAS